MKKVTWISLAVATLLLLFVAGGFYVIKTGGYQAVDIKGYSLAVPKAWRVETDEDSAYFFQKGTEVGSFSLLYKDAEITQVPTLAGFGEVAVEIKESDMFDVKVYELSFAENGRQILQYVFSDLPAAPPYKAVLTLQNVNERKGKRILSSVKLPDINENHPPKPIGKPDENFLSESAVYTQETELGILAYHTRKLDALLTTQKNVKNPVGLHILAYQDGEAGRTITQWYYLLVQEESIELYTYRQMEDGSYIYDNNPKRVKQLTKEVLEEEGIVRYLADGLLILEAPYNQYSDSQDALLKHKHAPAEDESTLRSVIESALPTGASVDSVSLQTEGESRKLTVRYVLPSGSRYVNKNILDETPFYQNALVLFSLIDGVDTISMEVLAEGEIYRMNYERKRAEKQFEDRDLREFTESEAAFSEFVEEIPRATPPPAVENEDTGKTTSPKIVFTDVVTVHSGQKITHPETGKLVRVDPYAEKYGVTQYLGRAITVTAYEQIVDGETRYWGTATCDGVDIATYPFPSKAEMERLIGLIP